MKKMNVYIFALPTISFLCFILIFLFGCSDTSNGRNSNTVTESGEITVISREEGSGTRDAFIELMNIIDENGYDTTLQNSEITNSTSVAIWTVKGNKRAIGYTSLGSLSKDVKCVCVDGVFPSGDSIKNGSYKLQRDFIVAYKEAELSAAAKDFLTFLSSRECEAIVNQEKYVGISSSESYKPSKIDGVVTLAGSTSVAPVMNVLADMYKELNPKVRIEIQESGSSAGIESALSGAVDIAMSSRALKENELAVLKDKVIALDGIAVIVHLSNIYDNLSSEQIKSIFSGETTKWEDLK